MFVLWLQRASFLGQMFQFSTSQAQGCLRCSNSTEIGDEQVHMLLTMHVCLENGATVGELQEGIEQRFSKASSNELFCHGDGQMRSWTGEVIQKLPEVLLMHVLIFECKVAGHCCRTLSQFARLII